MARIPEGEIERLKREVSVERLAEAHGVKLKRHGADLIGLCPFHEDHSPSLVINPQKNLWNCLGACGKGGSVIDWVMCAEGVSFRHAVELLRREHLPLAARPGTKPPQRSSTPKLPAPVSQDGDDRALLLQVTHYYHETLKNSPDALKYLQVRGLTSTEMIEQFQLGFADRTLGYGLPEKNRVAGAELRGRLQRLGILRETGHEHFNGSVVIPVFNLEGEVVEMYGRKITPGLRPGTPLHLYLPGARRGVWNEIIGIKDPLLTEFFATEREDIRGHGFHQIGFGLSKEKHFDPDTVSRFKTIWEERIASAVAAHEKRVQELWTFGWWFAGDIFDDDWALERLAAVLKLTGKVEVDHLVAKRLVKTVESKPKLTVECLSGMVEGVKEIYEILGWDKEAKTILAAALKSGDAETKAAAAVLINRLDARGLSGFRELLDDGTVWLNRA